MKLKHFLFPMLLIFAGLGFTACSSGSSTSDEGDDDEPEKNLAKEAVHLSVTGKLQDQPEETIYSSEMEPAGL